MDIEPILKILARWFHIVPACLALGGLFFIRIVFPIAARQWPADQREMAYLSLRRVFKMVVHTCVLLLLISGTYNTIVNWKIYSLHRGLMHGLWGMHLILALAVFAIGFWLLAGPRPPASHKKWAAISLGLIFILIALAGTLRYARDAYGHAG